MAIVCATFAATSAAAQTQPATTQPGEGVLIGRYVTPPPPTVLVGTWVDDAIGQRLRLTLDSQGNFSLYLATDVSSSLRLSRLQGHYFVEGNTLTVLGQTQVMHYTFVYTSPTPTLSGGDLPAPVAFTRVANVADHLRSLLLFSPTDATRKFTRILVIVAAVVAARLFIFLLQGLLALAVHSEWGPLKYVWRYQKNRALTIHSILLNIIKYIVYFTALGFVLSELGIPYTGYLASLSVVGLAIGFGSQGLVQDMVTGFFIILEGQHGVGDMIQIADQTGIVTDMGLRSTMFRNHVGQTVIIPNRNISIVGNFTTGSQQALVDIAIPGPDVAEKATATAKRVAEEIAKQFDGVTTATPEISPLILETGEHFVRVRMSIWPTQTWVIETQLVPRIRAAFAQDKIPIPNDLIAVTYHNRVQHEVNEWGQYVSSFRSKLSHQPHH